MDGVGLRSARRSAGGRPHPSVEVYIADTIGELGLSAGRRYFVPHRG